MSSTILHGFALFLPLPLHQCHLQFFYQTCSLLEVSVIVKVVYKKPTALQQQLVYPQPLHCAQVLLFGKDTGHTSSFMAVWCVCQT